MVDETEEKKLKAVMMIMNPGNRFNNIQGQGENLTFINLDLFGVIPNPEKYCLGGKDFKYQFLDCTRREKYYLSANQRNNLPIRINQGNFIKGIDLLSEVLEYPEVFLNLIMVKEPKKVNWSVAYLRITTGGDAWLF